MKQINKLDPNKAGRYNSKITDLCFINKINELIDNVNTLIPMKTPNIGETPEVDNTEGQVDNILKNLSTARSFLTNKSLVNSDLHSDVYFNLVIKQLKELNKPVETDKGEPFTIDDIKLLIQSVTKNNQLLDEYKLTLIDKLNDLK